MPRTRGRSDGDARRRGEEMVHHERDHLGEVAHGRLTAVALPVRVGHEADRGIEGEVRRDGRQVLGIERQAVLESEQRVGQQRRQATERQYGDRVLDPRLSAIGTNAKNAVYEPLERTQDRVEERSPFALRVEDVDQIHAEGFRHQDDRAENQKQLNPTGRRHLPRASIVDVCIGIRNLRVE
jgi:hypothetical protein